MAGTVVITEIEPKSENRPVRKVVFAWTSDASGVVSGTLTSKIISGEILRVVTKPGAATPTNNYGVTLYDENGIDVLGGRGASRSDTSTQHIFPGMLISDGTNNAAAPVAVCDNLELRVASAGNAKNGTVTVYVR